MMDACPAISLVGETSVSGSLQAMDCHIDAAVETGYGRLFGPGGAFGYALTAMLIIYVVLLAYGFMTGRTRLTVTMMSPRIMTMVLVLTFVSVWPAYHAVFYGLMMNGPDEIAAALLGERGSAVMNFAHGLDGLFVHFADIARRLDAGNLGTVVTSTGPQPMPLPHSMPVTLFWLSGLFLLVSTLGVLILTRMVLYLLLIIGPIFIVLALFPQTRGLFNGWLRTTLVFALAPLLTVLGGTAALVLFAPLIDAIGSDPAAAVKAVQPMVILFMGSMIYCAFLFVLMWVAASLVRDWQAALREKRSSNAIQVSAMSLPPQGSQTAAAMVAQAGGGSISDSYERTEPLIAAVSRRVGSSSVGVATGPNTIGLNDVQAHQSSNDRFSRVQGLGQRFRTSSATPSHPAPGVAKGTTPS